MASFADTPPSDPSFAALEALLEVEVRNLAGESWFIVPAGDRVGDLRASIEMCVPQLSSTAVKSQLFASGERLDDEEASLSPHVPPGGRLVVHIAPECIEEVKVKTEATDAPPPPERKKRSASPVVTIKHMPRPQWQTRLAILLATLIIVLPMLVGAFVLPTFPAPRTASSDTHASSVKAPPRSPSSHSATTTATRALTWGSGPVTAKLAMEAHDVLVNRSKLSITANLGAAPSTPDKLSLTGTTPRVAPPSPRPILFSLRLASSDPNASTSAVSDNTRAADSALTARAGPIEVNATWHLEDLWRAAYDAALHYGTSSSPTSEPVGSERGASTPRSSPRGPSAVAEPLKWQQQVMKAVKVVPLASVALSLWRPAGKRLLALALVLARTVLPAKRCDDLVRFVQARGLVPNGFEAIERTCDPMTTQGAKKKL